MARRKQDKKTGGFNESWPIRGQASRPIGGGRCDQPLHLVVLAIWGLTSAVASDSLAFAGVSPERWGCELKDQPILRTRIFTKAMPIPVTSGVAVGPRSFAHWTTGPARSYTQDEQ